MALPKSFIDEVRKDARELSKDQDRLKQISPPEMVQLAYRFYKQRRDLKKISPNTDYS